MRNPAPTAAPAAQPPRLRGILEKILGVIGLLIVSYLIALGAISIGQEQVPTNAWMETTRALGRAMSSYAAAHDGEYPKGASSTEVFQKLLDDHDVADPGIFYIPLPGKTKPVAGQKLKPENVSFDVTSDVDSASPEGLPIVFMTGYKVVYVPGAAAVPNTKPFPPFGIEPRTWSQWWRGESDQTPAPGIAVIYVGEGTKFLPLNDPNDSSASIPGFIPGDFDSMGKTYLQLTPDGPLP